VERTRIDLANQSEREILMNVVPRLENVEVRQDNLESAMGTLRKDLNDTETRLAQRVDGRFDKVDQHLSSQDDRIDLVVDKVAEKKSKWPQGAVIFVTSASTFAVMTAVAFVTHIFNF